MAGVEKTTRLTNYKQHQPAPNICGNKVQQSRLCVIVQDHDDDREHEGGDVADPRADKPGQVVRDGSAFARSLLVWAGSQDRVVCGCGGGSVRARFVEGVKAKQEGEEDAGDDNVAKS